MRSIFLGGVWRWAVGCALLAVFSAAPAEAASPFAGSYGGSVYLSVSGGSESVFAGITLAVDAWGTITGPLSGQVDGAGNIAWVTPNAYAMTNGVITNNVIASLGTSGPVSYRLAANYQASNFVGGGNLIWRTPGAGGKYLNAVTYGNGRFVAVGYAGTVATSSDGTNWVTPAVTGRSELSDVAYGNGLFLAVGNNSSVLVSTDGVMWSKNATNGFGSVAFGGAQFIAVNANGSALTSTDGSNWVSVAGAATGQGFTGIDYANGLFILFGATGKFQTSADGVTWNAVRTNGTTALTGAAYAAGRWVIGGNLRAVTFANATASDQAATNTSFSFNGVAGGSNLFVAATGFTYPPAFSTNGINWSFANGLADSIRSVAYGTNGMFVAVGNYIQSSTNGRAWTIRSSTLPAPVANNVGGTSFGVYNDQATFNDGLGRRREVRVGQGGLIEMRFLDTTNGSVEFESVYSPTTNTLRRILQNSSPLVAVGDKGTIVQYDINNLSWRTIASPTTADLYDAHLNSGGYYVVVGAGGVILSGYSGQPTNLTLRASGTANNLYSVSESSSSVVVGYRVLACGDNGTLLISTDAGVTWTASTTGVTNRLIRATAGDATDSAFAFPESGGFFLVTANNGINWSRVPFGATLRMNNAGRFDGGYTRTLQSGLSANLSGYSGAGGFYTAPAQTSPRSLTYGNGRFVLLGATTTAVSTNGIDWTAGRPELVYRYGSSLPSAVAYGQGIFIAVGAYGSVQSSVDGVNWTLRNSSLTNSDFNAIASGNGRFVAVGNGGMIYSSTNGVNWEDYSFANPSHSLESVAYGNGRFVIYGSTASGPTTRYSTNGVNWSVGGADSSMTSMLGYANGYFFGAGNNLIFRSTNGTGWSSINPGANFVGNQVAWGGGRYVIVGGFYSSFEEGSKILSSVDAINWVAETTAGLGDPTTYPILDKVVAANGQFVIYSEGSKVLTEAYRETNSLPLVTSQPAPASQSVNGGATVVYTASASGTGPLTYRWLKDGLPLFDGPGVSGATTTTLTLTGANALTAGNYLFSVASNFGSDISQSAALIVTAPPVITLQPQNTTVTNTGSTNLTVAVTGAAPLAFQWYQAGVPLTNSSYVFGANEKRVYFTTANRTNEANYFVVISNSFGSVTSAVVHVSVNRAPIVTQPPAAVTVFQGQPVLLSVVGDGTAPLAYQWKFNGSPIFNGTNQTYGYANGLVSSNGLYTVTITNLFGSVTSVAAAVTNIGPGVIRPDFNYTNTLFVQDIAATPDGNFLAAGSTTLTMLSGLYKFSLAGTAVSNLTGFQAINAYSPGFRTIGVLTDNSLVVGGSLEGSGSVAPRYTNLVRFLPNGQLDTAVRYPSSQIVQKIIPVAGGKFLALRAPDVASSSAFIARYNLDGTVDSSFTTLASGTGGYWGMGVQSNGTIWLGANSTGLQKANADGTGLTTVDGNSSAGRVFVAPDDRIFYAPAPGGGSLLRRRNADGTTNTFNVTFNNSVYAMAFLPNGQILAGGNFTTVNGVSSPYLVLLNDDGTRDPSFTSPFAYVAGAVNSILLLPDGSALVANNFSGTMVLRVQIYMPDLAFQKQPLAQTVNRTGTATFTAVATGNSTVSYQWRKNGVNINNATNASLTLVNVQDSAAGNYEVVVSNLSGTRTSGTAALTVLGNVQFTLQPVSQTVLAGTSFTLSATATGATPITFQWRHAGTNIPGATSSTFTIPSTGTNDVGTYDVVAANAFSSLPSLTAYLSLFANPAGIGGTPGTLDTNYFPAITNNGTATVLSVVLDANGKVLLTGLFTNFAGQPRSSFARLNADLSLDTPAPILGTDPIPAIGLPGGGFALGGYFTTVNGNVRNGLAFFDVSGSPLAQPTLSSSGYVDGGFSKGGFALQSDGKVVFGGYFTTVNGTARKSIARVNADGSLDAGFVPATLNSDVTAVAVQGDGKILVGGYFTTVNGLGQAYVARLNTNGTFDASFTNTFTISTPYGFKFQSDGKIILYGFGLTLVGGQTRYGIARLNTDGSLDNTFNANIGGVTYKAVYDVLVEADDRLVIVGAFDTVGGVARKCVARLNSGGSLDTSFAPGAGAALSGNPVVYSVVNLASGAYLIGGTFTSYDGVARPGLARLNGVPQPAPARAILQDPQSLTVVQGVTANFAVTATGTAPLTFQWRHAGTNLIGATNTSLSITNSQAVDVGTYDAVVTDATGSSTSQAATLSVQSAQIFATWVASFGLGTGQDATINDPDTDGLLNAVEFALGTHPSQGGAGQRPAALVKSVAGLFYPAVQFTRSRSATGVVIQVSASANVDFGTLLPLFETAQDLGNGLDLITVRSQSPVGTYPSFFFHITAVLP